MLPSARIQLGLNVYVGATAMWLKKKKKKSWSLLEEMEAGTVPTYVMHEDKTKLLHHYVK